MSIDRFVHLERGRFGFRINLRVLALTVSTALVLLATVGVALTRGSYELGVGEVVRALLGAGERQALFVVRTLRLPRVLAAVFIGPLLAASGAIFQGLVRNPLVSPDIIGVNAGAAAAAVFWIVTGAASAFLPLAAFAGAFTAATAVYLLSRRGHVDPGRLVLVGIGVNAMLSAATTLFIVRADLSSAQQATVWVTGSLYASEWSDVGLLAASAFLLLPCSVVLMWSLRVLQMGDITAISAGMRVELVRLSLLLAGCAMSAVAVTMAGPIGFVALVVPHIARILGGAMSGGVLLLTSVLGSVLLLSADIVAQHVLPVSLPVGVVTSAIGAPYFLYLLYRTSARI
ncbi:MAG: FecCD family ABC transporter permease [Spirochaetales bacterium]